MPYLPLLSSFVIPSSSEFTWSFLVWTQVNILLLTGFVSLVFNRSVNAFFFFIFSYIDLEVFAFGSSVSSLVWVRNWLNYILNAGWASTSSLWMSTNVSRLVRLHACFSRLSSSSFTLYRSLLIRYKFENSSCSFNFNRQHSSNYSLNFKCSETDIFFLSFIWALIFP